MEQEAKSNDLWLEFYHWAQTQIFFQSKLYSEFQISVGYRVGFCLL